ncbi:hypothetical protein [Aureimonas sp. AU22]|uniref:hypothetical protein n=1 Tax=Aureimonas sp. AU22 TaxID=1638162 RepID=UPI000B2CC2CA|nr:hypothetical protein [Aureimonas sp. AU22]
MILSMPRDIRGTQDGHAAAPSTLNIKFDDWQETTATGFGRPILANLRNTAIAAELEALKRRSEALEGSLRPTGH